MSTVYSIILSLSMVPQDTVISEQVSAVEINHFCTRYSEDWQHVFIFRDKYFHILGWRWCHPGGLLTYSGQWNLYFRDQSFYRRVRAPIFRETWTFYDLEVAERTEYPRVDLRPGSIHKALSDGP